VGVLSLFFFVFSFLARLAFSVSTLFKNNTFKPSGSPETTYLSLGTCLVRAFGHFTNAQTDTAKGCGPILIRLAWHDAGTYDQVTKTGGPRASMRFAPESGHGANAGFVILPLQILTLTCGIPCQTRNKRC
jgi:hypothetical protein